MQDRCEQATGCTRYAFATGKLSLACADVVKCVTYLQDKVQPALGGVHRQFKYSTVKEASLHAFQQQLELPVLKLKEPKQVKCLSYEAAVKAFKPPYAAIVLQLERQVDEDCDCAGLGWLSRIKRYEFVAILRLS